MAEMTRHWIHWTFMGRLWAETWELPKSVNDSPRGTEGVVVSTQKTRLIFRKEQGTWSICIITKLRRVPINSYWWSSQLLKCATDLAERINDHKAYFKLWHATQNNLGYAGALWTWSTISGSPRTLTYSRRQWFKPSKILPGKKEKPSVSLKALIKLGSNFLKKKIHMGWPKLT